MVDRLFSLADRVVVLTGGAGLLGMRYARALAEARARVVVADLDEGGARRVTQDVDGAFPIGVDVRNAASIQEMIEAALVEFGRIDALVNNAAIDPKFDRDQAERHVHEFETYPLAAWSESLAVNLTGAFLCAQAAAPALRESSGSIVNVSSIYGLVGPDQRLYRSDGGRAGTKPPDYSVTKAGLIGLTRYLATYFAGTGVRVNTLILGGVENEQDDSFIQRYSARTPLSRMARPDEYSGALLFLLSDAASYMTGASLVVDGGWTAW
ncbi:MAG: SDR family oxidoreductase [Gemmatimonas sp.]|nr:SDR family oxidoreductase [Gemmatimonas sp.]